jgi:hypothetical protein
MCAGTAAHFYESVGRRRDATRRAALALQRPAPHTGATAKRAVPQDE